MSFAASAAISDTAGQKIELPLRKQLQHSNERLDRSEQARTELEGTNARVVKVVSGGRAPGKSSSLASPQLSAIERFHCFGAVRLDFFVCNGFRNLYLIILSTGHTLLRYCCYCGFFSDK